MILSSTHYNVYFILVTISKWLHWSMLKFLLLNIDFHGCGILSKCSTIWSFVPVRVFSIISLKCISFELNGMLVWKKNVQIFCNVTSWRYRCNRNKDTMNHCPLKCYQRKVFFKEEVEKERKRDTETGEFVGLLCNRSCSKLPYYSHVLA